MAERRRTTAEVRDKLAELVEAQKQDPSPTLKFPQDYTDPKRTFTRFTQTIEARSIHQQAVHGRPELPPSPRQLSRSDVQGALFQHIASHRYMEHTSPDDPPNVVLSGSRTQEFYRFLFPKRKRFIAPIDVLDSLMGVPVADVLRVSEDGSTILATAECTSRLSWGTLIGKNYRMREMIRRWPQVYNQTRCDFILPKAKLPSGKFIGLNFTRDELLNFVDTFCTDFRPEPGEPTIAQACPTIARQCRLSGRQPMPAYSIYRPLFLPPQPAI